MNSYDIAETFGQMSKREVALLKACALSLPDDAIIVNIGAGFGTSAAAMLEEKPNSLIFSVDKFKRTEEKDNLIKCGLDHLRVVRILGNSSDIGRVWFIDLDLLFVDGGHSREVVQDDINLWTPFVKFGGFILFHDYNHRNCPWITELVDHWEYSTPNLKLVGKERYLAAFRRT